MSTTAPGSLWRERERSSRVPARKRFATFGFSLALSSRAQFTIHNVYGGIGTGSYGESVSTAGDVNGDGIDDFVVGAPLSDMNFSNSGSVIVYSGLDRSILYHLTGSQSDHYMGSFVSAAGDLNNDGFADFVAGIPGHTLTGSSAGACRFFSGADGSTLFTVHGGSNNARMGEEGCAMGDINGDGHDDVALALRFSSSGGGTPGRVVVVSGVDGSILLAINGATSNDAFAYSVACVGDVDGDSINDLIVGVLNQTTSNGISTGAAYVYSGATGAQIHYLEGASNGVWFGYSVHGGGDVNGDGIPDMVVGARFEDLNGVETRAGSATVFSGLDGSQLYKFWGDTKDDFFGSAVSIPGDVNLDGYADILIGAPDDDINAESGSVSLFSGIDGSLMKKFIGDNANDKFGFSVSAAGDLNSDGAMDLIVGVKDDDNFGSGSGSARIFVAPTVSLTPVGGGQANSPEASLFVNMVPTAGVAGPFVSAIQRGQYFSLDLYGAPLSFFDIYASYTLNPGGWSFPGFGLFDIGTGPTFNDVISIMSGFQGPFPFYATDATGQAHLTYFVQPFIAPGVLAHLQAVIQRPQPWTNGVWASITAAHSLSVQ